MDKEAFPSYQSEVFNDLLDKQPSIWQFRYDHSEVYIELNQGLLYEAGIWKDSVLLKSPLRDVTVRRTSVELMQWSLVKLETERQDFSDNISLHQ